MYITKSKMKSHFDLGIISFFLPTLSSLYIYIKTRKGIDGFNSVGKIGRLLVMFTHLIVAFHHAFGLYMACTIGKVIYLRYATYSVTFMFLWSFSALISWKLLTNTLDIGIEEEDEEDFDEEIGSVYDFVSSRDNADVISRRW